MPENQAPKFDLAALAAAAKESDPIERSRNVESKFANNPFVELLKRNPGTTMELPPVAKADDAKDLQSYLRDAATKNGVGLSTTIVSRGSKYVVKWATKAKRQSGGIAECMVCHDQVTVTGDGKIRIHGPRDARCEGSGASVSQPPENTETASA